MAVSKWDEVKGKLTLVEAWARDGLIETQIAKNLGISKATMENYKKNHLDFLDSLKRGKAVVDIEVENKLFQRAKGYTYEEIIKEPVRNKETGETTMEITKIVKKEVIPDTTAQIFWLKNRKPSEWRDKTEVDANIKGDINITLEGEVKNWAK